MVGRIARAGSLAFLLFQLGCTVGPDYAKPDDPVPGAWTEAQSGTVPLALSDDAWWKGFGDPLLDRIVDDSIAHSNDLAQALGRLRQARAERDEAAAAWMPKVEGNLLGSVNQFSNTLTYPPGGSYYREYAYGLDASWEVDIFGHTRRAVEGADALVAAAVEDRRAVLVSLIAEIVQDYAALRTSQARIDIAENNIVSARKSLELAERSLQFGLGTRLEVAQAKGQLETERAAVPTLKASVAQTAHAIAVLAGYDPGTFEAELSQPAPMLKLPSDLPRTAPSDVLRNRPDIRRAERQLAAANAEIGVAIAAKYPSFTIPLTVAPTSSFASELGAAKSLIYTLGVAASVPIYEGGALDAREEEAKAIFDQRKAAYAQTVLEAFRDMEDSLVGFDAERERNATLASAVEQNQIALDTSSRLYAAGLTDFLKVLESERSVYSSQDQLAQSGLVQVNQTILLFKALGAGWVSVLPEDAASGQD